MEWYIWSHLYTNYKQACFEFMIYKRTICTFYFIFTLFTLDPFIFMNFSICFDWMKLNADEFNLWEIDLFHFIILSVNFLVLLTLLRDFDDLTFQIFIRSILTHVCSFLSVDLRQVFLCSNIYFLTKCNVTFRNTTKANMNTKDL